MTTIHMEYMMHSRYPDGAHVQLLLIFPAHCPLSMIYIYISIIGIICFVPVGNWVQD